MTFHVTFSQPEDVTNPGLDGREYSFPFSIVDASLIGLPEEKSSTKSHRILLGICGSRLATWHLTESELPKVLFEFAKRYLVELVRSRRLPTERTIKAPTITTVSHPGTCPFDVNAIPAASGFSIDIEEQKPPMGF